MQSGNQHGPTTPWENTTTWEGTLSPVVIDPNRSAAAAVSCDDSISDDLVSQIKVLHVVNGEHFSGAERVQSHLGRCLPQFAVQADFACVKPGKFANQLYDEKGRWGTCFETEMKSRFDLRAAWKIRNLVTRHGYDLLHAHTPRTAMVASVASRMCDVPWIYHVHSPASRDSANSVSNRVNSLVENISLRGCSHLITVSESLRLDCIRRGHREDSVSVVHNGVPAICPPRVATPTVGGNWVIGMVALMRPRKGLEVVLEAIAKLKQQYNITLRIIGPFETDSYEHFIDDEIARLKISSTIQRVGFTRDVPAELAKLDAMVLPSLFGEGLPMVVLEAMAAGLPVIATRVEGTPEAVTDGVEGLLAQPRDADSLAERIAELVSGRVDWQQMSDAAKTRHGKDFSDVAMAEKTATVYRRLLSQSAIGS